MTATSRTLLKGGLVATAAGVTAADILIEGERIQAVGVEMNLPADRVIDVTGHYVLPGGIDVHTHLDMPSGGTPTVTCDDFFTGTRAAAMGGTTCVVDFAIQYPGQTLNEAIDHWQAKAQARAVIDYGFHLIVTDVNPNTLAEMESVVARGVTSFKLFTAYPGVFMVDDSAVLGMLTRAQELGALVMIHAENGALIEALTGRLVGERKLAPRYHAAAHDGIAEVEATGRVLQLAEAVGAPIYIVHVSMAEAMERIRTHRQRGLPAFGETCPHYPFLDETLYATPGFDAAKYVMSPPLRDRSNHAPLWNALRTDGLQVVATDHCPFNLKGQKELGLDSFTKIPNGAPGIEDRMRLLFDTALAGALSFPRLVELTATNPARLFGLSSRKGHIGAGFDADFVVWDPAAHHTISAATHAMNIDYNLYEGRTVKGKPILVMSRGEVLVQDGAWLERDRRGRYLARGPSGAL